jgi:serine/threonine-protein kinase
MAAAPITPPSQRSLRQVPPELEPIVMRALTASREDRYEDASGLASDLGAWLDGAQRRERALAVVIEARGRQPGGEANRARARALRGEARRLSAALSPDATEQERWPAWEKEDAAAALEAEADAEQLAVVQLLEGALTHAPDHPDAHASLAEFWHREHAAAEARGDASEARRAEIWLRQHDRGRFATYLSGTGALSLVTNPAGATVHLHAYELKRRRLEPVYQRVLGQTPLGDVALPMGSYLLEIRSPGHHPVSYPVQIGRGVHWDGVPPGATEPFPIDLPPLGSLADDDCYVPAGWFWSGGDLPQLQSPLPRRRLWCHAFVMQKYPVTNREYVGYLEGLRMAGREDEALARCPSVGKTLLYQRGPDGAFQLGRDQTGAVWAPDMPVVAIDWHDAVAYAQWRADYDGLPWRLCHELEWQKAARGVDERTYPWGTACDPSMARMLGSRQEQLGPGSITEHPGDISPYGVCGMAGNISDWTLDAFPQGTRVVGDIVSAGPPDDAKLRVIAGGHWMLGAWWCRSDTRRRASPTTHSGYYGFRLTHAQAPVLLPPPEPGRV